MRHLKAYKTPATLMCILTALFTAVPTIAVAELSDYYEQLPWYSYLIGALALACAVGLLIWLFGHRGKAKVDLMSDVLSENIARPQIAEQTKDLDRPVEEEADAAVVDDVVAADEVDEKVVDDSDIKGNEWVEVD